MYVRLLSTLEVTQEAIHMSVMTLLVAKSRLVGLQVDATLTRIYIGRSSTLAYRKSSRIWDQFQSELQMLQRPCNTAFAMLDFIISLHVVLFYC